MQCIYVTKILYIQTLQYFMERCLIYGLELEADSRFALLKTVVYV